jgi:GH15 family glucan-1,4-alpha-glucosidase
MRSTFARLMASLSPRPGLLYRYRGPGDDEGAFGVCSFWIAEHLARGGGTLAQALEAFRATTAYANDVGLMAEEVDPATGRALGNFPQTFTHVGLLNAALSIAQREKEDRAA